MHAWDLHSRTSIMSMNLVMMKDPGNLLVCRMALQSSMAQRKYRIERILALDCDE